MQNVDVHAAPPMRVRPRVSLRAALVAASTLLPLAAQARPRPPYLVVRDVRLTPEAEAPAKVLVLRDGRIEAVLDEGARTPAGATVVDGKRLLALPAFVDAYTHAGCVTPAPVADRDQAAKPSADVHVDMREANRKGIGPAFRAADAFAIAEDLAGRYRSSGFCALLSAPHGQLLSGSSALASTRDAAVRDRLLRPQVFDHAGLDAPGPGYPSTKMGSIAQLRQFFLDAAHARELAAPRAHGAQARHPPYDRDLEAVGEALARARRVACEADSDEDVERWIALGDELGFDVAIAGGRDAWKRAGALARRGVPVIATLSFGDEPKRPRGAAGKPEDATAPAPSDDAIYVEPERVFEERRRLWRETRDGVRVLVEAGVAVAFGSGSRSPKDLIATARELVEAGLPLAQAEACLTTRAAEILGLGASLGRIEPGFDASLALWTAHPLLSKDAKVAWIAVEGFPYELEVDGGLPSGPPEAGVSAEGEWTVEIERSDAPPASLKLEMTSDGTVTGTWRGRPPGGTEQPIEVELEGRLARRSLRLSGRVEVAGAGLSLVLEGEIEGQELRGQLAWTGPAGPESQSYTATRAPKRDGGRR